MTDTPLLPVTDDPLDRHFWQAANEGRLDIQQCTKCDTYFYPPRVMCGTCQNTDLIWRKMSGRGRIWSFVVVHPPLLPAYAHDAPYPVVLVELEEDPALRMTGNLLRADNDAINGAINDIDPAILQIGAPVELCFRRLADDVNLPCWKLLDNL